MGSRRLCGRGSSLIESTRDRRSLGKEPLRRCGEALIGMVNQDVASPQGGEDGRRARLRPRNQAGRYTAEYGGKLAGRGRSRPAICHNPVWVEHARDLVAVRGVDADPLLGTCRIDAGIGLVHFEPELPRQSASA